MKVRSITLKSYLHFKKDLLIDLTYPAGHPDEGKPLRKICFLGQSATGKTTLLNVIKYFTCDDLEYNRAGIDEAAFISKGPDLSGEVQPSVEVLYDIGGKTFWKGAFGDRQFQHKEWDGSYWRVVGNVSEFKAAQGYALKTSNPLLINFPFGVVQPEDPKELDANELFNKEAGELGSFTTEHRRIWDFDPAIIRFLWSLVLKKAEEFVKQRQAKIQQEFKEVLVSSESEVGRIKKSFEEWEQSHPNPLHQLAHNCLNRVLKHLNLEVETDLDKYNVEERHGRGLQVLIKRIGGDHPIRYEYLSTGTKQVLLTATPLFYLKPENAVILFDQPETSLYPNIQRVIPDVYVEAVPESNQFFFATHSPIVASAFDPWEVVELRFNQDGEVEQRPYFETERRLENYFIWPKLLRWDSAYRILFDVGDEGNPEREKKLTQLASLEARIKETKDPLEKRELFASYKKLAAELDWNIR